MVQHEAMKEWVPLPVQRYIRILLDGDEHESSGWRDALAKAEDELAQLTKKLRTFPRGDDSGGRDDLSRQRVTVEHHVSRLKANVDALVALGTDIRMREAYTQLGKEFNDDSQWRGFVAAAWAADMDFSKVRQRIREAREHNDRIARVARDLADLLERASDFGISWPLEFGDVATLLRTTDNHEMQDHNLGMWRVMRRHVLGERREGFAVHPSHPEVRQTVSYIRRETVREGDDVPSPDPVEQARADVVYAWSVAPPLSALLRTLYICARDFQPDEYGLLKAAVGTRQRNPKTEYLRAFGHILGERKIDVTPVVMKAMAIVSTVIIDDPDIDVTYDDVRKVLSGSGLVWKTRP